jgi:Ras association domain-containing protein 7/8
MEELHLTQHQMQHRQQEWLERETATLAEIDRLRKELELTRRETEAANDISGNMGQEVQSIEASLSEKKKQMERLVAAMKEANLQSLSIQPPEDLIEVHHRSGSTRRMIGSPRQLENAAPTSKNPHGVWV